VLHTDDTVQPQFLHTLSASLCEYRVKHIPSIGPGGDSWTDLTVGCPVLHRLCAFAYPPTSIEGVPYVRHKTRSDFKEPVSGSLANYFSGVVSWRYVVGDSP